MHQHYVVMMLIHIYIWHMYIYTYIIYSKLMYMSVCQMLLVSGQNIKVAKLIKCQLLSIFTETQHNSWVKWLKHSTNTCNDVVLNIQSGCLWCTKQSHYILQYTIQRSSDGICHGQICSNIPLQVCSLYWLHMNRPPYYLMPRILYKTLEL